MRILFGLIILFIIYGSFYPFDFDLHSSNIFEWGIYERLSRGDILQNVLLFLPYGFLGPLIRTPLEGVGLHQSQLRYFVRFLVYGFIFAFVIQVAQLYFPSRVAALSDAVLNLLGLMVGYGLGVVFQKEIRRGDAFFEGEDYFPLMLCLSWLAYKLFPFVPTIDFASVKNALKPLLLHPEFEIESFVTNLFSWYLFGYLFVNLRRKLPLVLLYLIAPLTIGSQMFIMQATISLSEFLAAFMILCVWALGLSKVYQNKRMVLGIGCLGIVFYELFPFSFVEPINSFSFIPFKGLLNGSIFANILALIQKVFIYGAVLEVFLRSFRSKYAGFAFLSGLVMICEMAQIYIPKKTPEIFDFLLVCLLFFIYNNVKTLNLKEKSE